MQLEDAEANEAIQKEIAEKKAALEEKLNKDETKKVLNVPSVELNVSYNRKPGDPQFLLCFQGLSFEDAFNKGILWAPEKSVKGIKRAYYERIHDIYPQSLVFNCSEGYIKAISETKATPHNCQVNENMK